MKAKFDKYEKDLLDSYEKGEWIEVSDMKNEIKKHITYAKATRKKDKGVNIRISQRNIESIQRKAIEEGIPYQTLISSLIYKFNSGKLIEKRNKKNSKTVYNIV